MRSLFWRTLLISVGLILWAACAWPQAANSSNGQASDVISSQEPSLGDMARKARAERANQKPAARVFTNTNLPTEGGLSIVGPPANTPASGAEGVTSPDAKWFTDQTAELQGRLNMHQRELSVLQQKLNLAQTLYYSDPQKQLDQQYSMADVKDLQHAIEEKKQQIEEDEKAIEELRVELQRRGGNPGWIRAGMATAGNAPPLPPPPDATPGKHDQAYWRERFSQARERVAMAKEARDLAEQELELLKRRQATELSQSEISAKLIDAEKNAASSQAALAKAEADLAVLQQQFDQSGAPAEWSDPQ